MKFEVRGVTAFAGTGSRPLSLPSARAPVVFVHGAGMDHTVWVMPARHFARHGHAVLAPDLPGHGRSQGAPLGTVEAMADWLAEVLQTLHIDSAAVVGHSMGSLAAYAFAARHPAHCQRLVLLGASLPMPVTDQLLQAAADNDHAAIEMANTWSHSRTGRLGGNANPGLWMFGGGERLLERSRPGVFHADLTACNRFDPGALPTVSQPATVVVGTADQMTPARAGRDVAARLAASGGDRVHVRELPGAGHAMLTESPNPVLDILREALAEPA